MRLTHAAGSAHSASVRIALAEKGLAWESREIDLATFGQLAPEHLALNASGQVPVLEDGACRVTEAFFILLYLDEQYPEPPLGGGDPRARYQVHKWGKYVETHIAPNLALLRWAEHGKDAAPPPADALDRLPSDRRALWTRAARGFSADEVETARAALDKAAARLSVDLAQHDWLAGPDFTIADIAVFPHAARFSASGVELPAPAARWLERMVARPSVGEDSRRDRDLVTMGPEKGRWG